MPLPEHILLVNPYIEDFSAYDHFSRPLGLYTLAGLLSPYADISLINVLQRPRCSRPRPDGTGPWLSRPIPVPAALRDIPRTYKRYGIPEQEFLERLAGLPRRPDVIMLGSGMTYWYSAIDTTVELIQQVWQNVPIILGGIYACLLPEHASLRPGISHSIPFQEPARVLQALSVLWDSSLHSPDWLPPRYDLEEESFYYPVLTSQGCVFHCSYCAGHGLSRFRQYPASAIADLIIRLGRQGSIRRFAFYDDALLYQSEQHLDLILQAIIQADAGLEFFTPNGLHVRFLNLRTARLMKEAGVRQIRLSLESADPAFMLREGDKAGRAEFLQALEILQTVGYRREDIQVYTLANVPGQDPRSIEMTMQWIWEAGALPYLAFYSPIPGTPDFVRASRLTDLSDPLFHNDTVYLYRSGFDSGYYQHLRSLQNSYRRMATAEP